MASQAVVMTSSKLGLIAPPTIDQTSLALLLSWWATAICAVESIRPEACPAAPARSRSALLLLGSLRIALGIEGTMYAGAFSGFAAAYLSGS